MNTYDIRRNPSRLRPAAIHASLARSDWSPGIPQEIVSRAIANSICFGVYLGDAQVGFAPPARPENLMEIRDPDPYGAGTG